MKQLLFLFILLSPIHSPLSVDNVSTSYVYVCTGPKSKRYHGNKNCRGLQNCSEEIKKVTVDKAKGMGRTPCKIKGCLD